MNRRHVSQYMPERRGNFNVDGACGCFCKDLQWIFEREVEFKAILSYRICL